MISKMSIPSQIIPFILNMAKVSCVCEIRALLHYTLINLLHNTNCLKRRSRNQQSTKMKMKYLLFLGFCLLSTGFSRKIEKVDDSQLVSLIKSEDSVVVLFSKYYVNK